MGSPELLDYLYKAELEVRGVVVLECLQLYKIFK